MTAASAPVGRLTGDELRAYIVACCDLGITGLRATGNMSQLPRELWPAMIPLVFRLKSNVAGRLTNFLPPPLMPYPVEAP